MNILFLTLSGFSSIEDRGIYSDLLRKFRDKGHNVTIVKPKQRRFKVNTNFKTENGVEILEVKTLNITKTHFIEKGIATLAIEYQYLNAVKKYLSHKKFDLVMYTTPPITLVKVVEYIKKKDQAKSYLLLKDIFPQNAIDMKMLKPNGFLHKFFKNKEKALYNISDKIGCMSQANVDFILNHNPEISVDKVEVNPNSIDPIEINYSDEEKRNIRQKYDLPTSKRIFVYGGNLGKPQGVDFLMETIANCKNSDVYFLIVGDGTEFPKLNAWFEANSPNNTKLLQRLPKNDYDRLLAACEVGLIFLHKDFLIPNFPSRLLSYLEMGMPIITATDPNSDIGDVVEQNKCGYKVLAGDLENMLKVINKLGTEDLSIYKDNCSKLLHRDYTVEHSYELIIDS